MSMSPDLRQTSPILFGTLGPANPLKPVIQGEIV